MLVKTNTGIIRDDWESCDECDLWSLCQGLEHRWGRCLDEHRNLLYGQVPKELKFSAGCPVCLVRHSWCFTIWENGFQNSWLYYTLLFNTFRKPTRLADDCCNCRHIEFIFFHSTCSDPMVYPTPFAGYMRPGHLRAEQIRSVIKAKLKDFL